jgi:hypothetical protein
VKKEAKKKEKKTREKKVDTTWTPPKVHQELKYASL